MGKHARSSRLLRLGIPLVAAGSVFAVIGVSSVLLGHGAPAPAARAADKTPAAVSSSSVSTLYGCAESEGGLSTSVLPTTAQVAAQGIRRYPEGAADTAQPQSQA